MEKHSTDEYFAIRITSHTGHTDAYGFKQSFDSEEPTMLYLASRLLSVYSVYLPEEERKIMQWNELLESNFNLIPRVNRFPRLL